MLLGHIVQTTHIALCIAMGYSLAVKPQVTAFWVVGVISANVVTGGDCPITLLANKLFENAGHPGYPDVASWLSSVMLISYGGAGALIIGSSLFGVLVGFMVSGVKEFATPKDNP